MKKKYVALTILLSIILIVIISGSYFIALNVVSDAVVYRIGFSSRSGSVSIEPTKTTLSGIFILENRADIPLAFDVNIKVFVYPVENQPFNGNLEFLSGPGFDDMQFIGNVSAKNAQAPPHGQAEVPGSFDIVPEDALNVIRNGNFTVLWVTYEIEVTGSFIGWSITKVPAFQ
jgi:hypothetical protein